MMHFKLMRVLCLAVVMLTAIPVIGRAADQPTRPNILWIIAEDLSPDLGYNGNTAVKTPNIDALAKQGVQFTQVIGTSSVCSVNRSAMHTGMYQTSIGAQNHRTPMKSFLSKGVSTLPKYFEEAGYYVCNGSGKFNPKNPDWPLKGKGKVDWNFNYQGLGFEGTDWSGRKPGQPFFAEINIKETHRVFTGDRKRPIDPASITIPPYYPDHPLTRMDWKLYLEDAQILDDKVSAILKRLDDEGLADNTIVFFFGDNGRPFCRGKIFLYEAGLKVPLIIRYPDGHGAGTVNNRLVSMIDFLPTTMDMCGIDIPSSMQGESFADPNSPPRDVVYAQKDRVGSVPDRIRAVRDNRYKYIRNYHPEIPYLPGNRYSMLTHPTLAALLVMAERGELNDAQKPFTAKTKPVEELYDLKNDPYEIHNLADDPSQKDRLIAFRKQLEQWIVDTKDQGVVPETPEQYLPYKRTIDRLEAKYLAERCGGMKELTAQGMYGFWMKHYHLTEKSQEPKS